MTIPDNGLSAQCILLIDDDDELLKLTGDAFAQAGYQVYTATDGLTGLRHFYTCHPHLVILDLELPGLTGWEVCGRIRQLSNVPLILTGLGENEQIVRGLDEGADDYLIKPVNLKVLLAQARAALRRAALPPVLDTSLTYQDDYLTLDLAEQRVLVRAQPVALTQMEYKLLAYLYRYAEHLRSHRQILAEVWGRDQPASVDVVHKNIGRLRQKLGENPRQARYLVTEHGIGYRFKKYPGR